MAVLTRPEVLKEIEAGNIRITPFEKKNLGPASIDLRLSNMFRVFEKAQDIIDVTENADYKKITSLVEKDSIVVLPKDTILGMTEEKITLAPNICGRLEGRSRFSRLGLLVHISASFMQPGISNHQVLEITNMGHVPLRLHAGTRICQFIFETALGKAKYKGRWADQAEP